MTHCVETECVPSCVEAEFEPHCRAFGSFVLSHVPVVITP